MEQRSKGTFSYIISEKGKDQRIDVFLSSQIKNLTRSRVQDLIKEKHVRVNGRAPKPGYRLRIGDQISLVIPPAVPYQLESEPVKFTPLYEDASLIVLNKPPGLVIHPAPGHLTGTLVHGLLQYCDDLSGVGGILRPGIVHRLDKDTSGLVVVAKNDRAHALIGKQFKARTVKKKYLALVHGVVGPNGGEIDLPIARHPRRRKEMSVTFSRGRRALTLWKRAEEFEMGFSLLSVLPKTGRTHQIRVHLSYIGHPIVGDPVYGHKKNWWKKHPALMCDIFPWVKRQLLHAEILGFVHPVSEIYCEFRAPLPDDMAQVIRALRRIDLQGDKDKKA